MLCVSHFIFRVATEVFVFSRTARTYRALVESLIKKSSPGTTLEREEEHESDYSQQSIPSMHAQQQFNPAQQRGRTPVGEMMGELAKPTTGTGPAASAPYPAVAVSKEPLVSGKVMCV